MPWQILLVLWISCGHVLGPILLKQLAAAPSRTRNLLWQYIFTFIFSLLALAVTNSLKLDWGLAIIAITGLVCACAAYCYWRAVDISLSKTTLFGQAGGLVAMLLGYIFLNEARHLNLWIWIGLALSLGSVGVLTITRAHSAFANNESAQKQRGIWFWLLACCLVWGFAGFSMRFFSLREISPWNFVAAWYSGAIIGAVAVFRLAGKQEAGQPLIFRNYWWILPRSVVIWASLTFSCWTMKFAPITVVQPIVMVSGTIFPIILGLWIFRENQILGWREKLTMAIGMVGSVIIALNY